MDAQFDVAGTLPARPVHGSRHKPSADPPVAPVGADHEIVEHHYLARHGAGERRRRARQQQAGAGQCDGRRFYENFGFAAANDRLVLAA